MKIAYSILQRSIGTSFPNPTVVRLIVESDKEFINNEIKSFGITEKGGRPHAEKIAIENLRFKSNKIYTLYSTLEPCCHKGRENACVNEISEKPINRVVYSIKDPDRRVNGLGEKILKKNGIEVISGLLEEKISKVYQGYILNRKLKRPKITIKIASSLDGKISIMPKLRSAITNRLSNKIVHLIRSKYDAILIGANTLKIDNPKLNCRIKGLSHLSPIRVILLTKLDVKENLEIFKNCRKIKTILFSKESNPAKMESLTKKGVKIFILKKKDYNLKRILEILAKLGISNLLVEGGAKIFTSFIQKKLCDELLLFQSNFFIGNSGETILKSKNLGLLRNKFELKKTIGLNNNLLSIFENLK